LFLAGSSSSPYPAIQFGALLNTEYICYSWRYTWR